MMKISTIQESHTSLRCTLKVSISFNQPTNLPMIGALSK